MDKKDSADYSGPLSPEEVAECDRELEERRRQFTERLNRELDERLDRELDRKLDRELDRKLDRELDRKLDRELDRNIERRIVHGIGGGICSAMARRLDRRTPPLYGS